MATIIPAGVYGLRVPAGGTPIIASVDPRVAFRITMAAIDPTADADPTDDGGHKVPRATLKLIRIEEDDDDDDDEDDDDFDPEDIEGLRAKLRAQGVLGSDDDDDDDDMSLDDEDSEEEKNGGPSDPAKSKKAKRDALAKKAKEELDAEEMELDQLVNGKSKGKGKALNGDLGSESEEDSEDEEGDEVQTLVICTLDPEKHWQQPLEITVREGEQVFFSANGTHDIFLSGNYVAIQDDSDDEEEDDDEYGLNGLDYDLSPDEDELDEDLSESEEDELDGLEDPRIMEVESDEEEVPKLVKVEKKNKNKRPAESEDEESAITLDELISKTKAETPTTNGEKLSKKQAKKLKNNDGQAVAAAQAPAKKDAAKTETPSNDKKKVQFSKNLEMGPTGSPKVEEAKKDTPKGPRTVSGVLIDDKKEGKGRPAKKGDRIEMRYIGKLKNGKQFDANKKGKPFAFKLGVGEVIKGWDIGVAGMTAGGERRLTIPAKLAYGNKSLPGIPANSDLIFDIKCISVN